VRVEKTFTALSADMIDDMVTSASFSAWAPLIKGTPRIAHERFYWSD
jgi:hypothetical protein